jgi:hypothetical protein
MHRMFPILLSGTFRCCLYPITIEASFAAASPVVTRPGFVSLLWPIRDSISVHLSSSPLQYAPPRQTHNQDVRKRSPMRYFPLLVAQVCWDSFFFFFATHTMEGLCARYVQCEFFPTWINTVRTEAWSPLPSTFPLNYYFACICACECKCEQQPPPVPPIVPIKAPPQAVISLCLLYPFLLVLFFTFTSGPLPV